MGFDAHVLKVLIASPGDTGRERDAIENALHGWNNARAEREQDQDRQPAVSITHGRQSSAHQIGCGWVQTGCNVSQGLTR